MKKIIAIAIVVVFLFALGVPGFAATSSPGGGGSGTPTTPGGPVTSPQTGYSTALWTLCGAALLLGAGVCFAAARKSSRA